MERWKQDVYVRFFFRLPFLAFEKLKCKVSFSNLLMNEKKSVNNPHRARKTLKSGVLSEWACRE